MKFGLTIAKDSIEFGILELDMVSTIASGVETVESNQMMGEYALGGGIGDFEKAAPVYSVIVSGAGDSQANGTYTFSGMQEYEFLGPRSFRNFVKGTYIIKRRDELWILTSEEAGDNFLYYYDSYDELPNNGEWFGYEGPNPAPTILVVEN